MHSMKRAAALLVAAGLAATLAACGSGGPGQNQSFATLNDQAQYNPQPYDNLKDGGTLTTAIPEISPQFNIFESDFTGYSLSLWNWYNPMLVSFTANGDPIYNPDYLSDVKSETVGGNTRVTFTINPKAVYNDGSPIDWHSFEATWRADNGKDPSFLAASTDGFNRIASVTQGVNDRQAVVTFNGTYLWWPALFSSLLNPKAANAQAFNQGYVNTPHNEWGAGPYQVQKFDQNNGTVTFTRNPRWWGKRGKLDSRTFLAMEDVASVNAFRNGQIDAVSAGQQSSYAQVKDMPGIDIRKGPSLQTDYFTLNGQSPVLSDIRVRKAIFEAIDRTQISHITFNGLGYTAEPVGSMLFLPFQKGYQDNVSKVVQFNPDQAKKDLDAAGWVAGPDGVRAKNGQPLRFTYVNTGDDPIGKAVSGGLAAMLKNVGIQMDIRQVPSADFSKIITGKQFDMFYSGGAASNPFALSSICQLYCSNGTFIKSGVNDPKNDALVNSVSTLPTADEAYARGNQAEAAEFATYGVLPTVELPDIVAVKKGLANYGATRFFTPFPETVGWQK
jgi:peptide/nickel transport system substrate-binding protein